MRWAEVLPAYRIKRTDDTDEIRDLALQCFTDGELEHDDVMEATTWWICCDGDGDAAGFVGARTFCDVDGTYAYLSLVGVLPHARGARLTERLTRTVLRWARREGCYAAITYSSVANPASMRNLIRAGFLPYWPEVPWVGEEKWVYLRADLGQPATEPYGAVR
jgi:GNAT superfamily N-acetyltransferase